MIVPRLTFYVSEHAASALGLEPVVDLLTPSERRLFPFFATEMKCGSESGWRASSDLVSRGRFLRRTCLVNAIESIYARSAHLYYRHIARSLEPNAALAHMGLGLDPRTAGPGPPWHCSRKLAMRRTEACTAWQRRLATFKVADLP